MMREEIKKRKEGYYVQRHFDGNSGVPKCTFYLNHKKGEWNDGKLTKDCFFPTPHLALAFLRLRLKYECAQHTTNYIEYSLKEDKRRWGEDQKHLEELERELPTE